MKRVNQNFALLDYGITIANIMPSNLYASKLNGKTLEALLSYSFLQFILVFIKKKELR
jgi:hypothetical protein